MQHLPLHPLAFASFPLLFLYAENAQFVRFGKVLAPLALSVGVAAGLALVASLVLRSLRRGALAASGAALLSLSYGHVAAALGSQSPSGFSLGRDAVLLPAWTVLGAAVLWLAWRVRSISETTAVANAIGIGLMAMASWSTASSVMALTGPVQTRPGEDRHTLPDTEARGVDRDIYYIVPDRYGSEETLREQMGIDNSDFTDALEQRGFYVAGASRSNYPTTAHALASALNMDYLDGLAEEVGFESSQWRPLYAELVGSRLPAFLREQGYRHVHIGPWYDPTAHDPTSDVNFHYDRRSEFTRVWIETTIVRPLATRLGFLADLDGRRHAHNQVLFQLESLQEAADASLPTFTFAHILAPHPPYTFDSDGRYIDGAQEARLGFEEAYKGQLRFINSRLLDLIDDLLDVPADEQPIIVLQSDEGPKPEEWEYGGELRWEEASDNELELKFSILNAIFLPGTEDPDLYPSITPVNTFRLILDAYFQTGLGLLADRHYVYGNGREPYLLTDVTDRLAGRRQTSGGGAGGGR